MPKSSNQKLRILYVKDYLLKYTDENHPVTVAQLVEYLSNQGIMAERKTIYSDFELLKYYGLDIVMTKGKSTGYFIANREFELPELKLLVDSVQSSKFITNRKTLSLIKKIESLTNVYDAGSLQRQVYVHNRVKSMNESVYVNVDAISEAISNDKIINFKYYKYKIDKTREFRHDGMTYKISPFALIWDDENYYMLGYDSTVNKMKHFRVDKMYGIRSTNISREGKKVFKSIDMSSYNTKVFGMYGGKQQKVKLRFENYLIEPVIDRFGRDVIIIDEKDGHFSVTIDAQISPQFFAWIFGFGDACEIISPDEVRDEMKEISQKIVKMYS